MTTLTADRSATPVVTALVAGVRSVVNQHADWPTTAELVAKQLREHLPDLSTLGPDHTAARRLHIEPDGSFSVLALTWQPGQITRIHDHITWCAFGVVRGIEHEELFDEQLNLVGVNDNRPGDVSGFAPPGDIHRLHNITDQMGMSIHIYGTDVSRIGSSVRRYYD
jgi:predicted metal-dependent enzyme (double-stranded beta helix superfamily)